MRVADGRFTTDPQWPLHPINRTPAANPAGPGVITPRLEIALPGPHAANAPNASLRICERQLNTHDAHLAGLSTLLDALVLSIGPASALLLADPCPWHDGCAWWCRADDAAEARHPPSP